jgi:hypothetical protein
VVRLISSNVVWYVPGISFRRFFQQVDGSSTEEVSFVRYMPNLIIFTAILSVIFLLFGVDPSAVFVAVGVSALGFSAAVYLLSKRFGKMPERGFKCRGLCVFHQRWFATLHSYVSFNWRAVGNRRCGFHGVPRLLLAV